MENRITKLEVEFGYVRRDLDEIKTELKDISHRLARMPTTNGLWGMIATVIGVALTMIGITVGVIAHLTATLP
ncbi:hypothetical protein [Roseospira goensis]|uniref:Flagellar motor component MotA n=1 Tax=Roseospira goensis TaxID=391922 RepID=A0A7W6WM51_9PROT|nr:hypothetical protein [Roseospira goensis]MBB4287564.1 flagellar motor component MotA [Roseospira goensis]